MAEEPWDELMGPSRDDLRKMLSSGPPPTPPQAASSASSRFSTPPAPPMRAPPVKRSTPSSTPPPSSMFNTMPDRWSQYGEPAAAEQSAATAQAVATASSNAALRESLSASGAALNQPEPLVRKRSTLPIEDEDEEDEEPLNFNGCRQVHDADQIRQEALKMMEVVDDQLTNSNYSVHRTITGGFQASSRPLSSQKRVPTALAGLSFVGNRKNLARPYHDDPFSATDSPPAQKPYRDKESSEYGEYEGDHDIADVIGMANRTSSSRPAEGEGKNWSSRYSVDHTLLALSGGSVSSSKFLDQMDKDTDRERRAARNLFGSSPTKAPKVFGSGFSFRQNHVFGRQKATVAAPQTNLRTVWMDTDTGSMPPASPRSKTWQEQLTQKRQQRRIYIALTVIFFAFIVTVASVLRPNSKTTASQSGIAPGSVSFYVTSNVPYSASDEDKMVNDLTALSTYGNPFMVHLGNIQESRVTLCQSSRYSDVAEMLKNSPMPMFVLPGEEDWSNCPDPNAAWNSWSESFSFFDSNFDKPFEVQRRVNQQENFAFVNQGVLFIGVHVVNGRIVDEIGQEARNAANFDWIFKRVNENQNKVRAIVVFGNARPGHPQNEDFFTKIVSFLDVFGLPSAYIHGNSGDGGVEEVAFADSKNVISVQAQNGGQTPPLRITVSFGNRPFIVG